MKNIIQAIKSKIHSVVNGTSVVYDDVDYSPQQLLTNINSKANLTYVFRRIELAIRLDCSHCEFHVFGGRTKRKETLYFDQIARLRELGYTVEINERIAAVGGWEPEINHIRAMLNVSK